MEEENNQEELNRSYAYKMSGKRYWDSRGIVHNKKNLFGLIEYQKQMINVTIKFIIIFSTLIILIVTFIIILLIKSN